MEVMCREKLTPQDSKSITERNKVNSKMEQRQRDDKQADEGEGSDKQR
jgi:hypothetical protein